MRKEEVLYFIAYIIFMAIVLSFFLFGVKVERDTFNYCRDADVTYIQAMFTNLRVEDCK